MGNGDRAGAITTYVVLSNVGVAFWFLIGYFSDDMG